MHQRGHFVLMILLGLGLPGNCADGPEAAQFEGKTVAGIQFKPANQPLPPEELAGRVPLKTGALFADAQLRDAIRRLYASGVYSDVWAEGHPSDQGVLVVFHTTARWFVGRVEGDRHVRQPPTAAQMVSASRFNLGQPFQREDMKTALDRVMRTLQGNGFYEAKVEPRVSRDEQHHLANLQFDVQAGPRARLETPIITGTPELDAQAVAKATKWHRIWPFGWKQATRANVQGGLQKLRGKYHKEKRLTATITLDGLTYDQKSRRATPKLKINAGPKVDIAVAGAKVSNSKLKAYIPVYDEMKMDTDLLTEGSKNLRSYFQTQGYFDAEVSHEIMQVAPDRQRVVYTVKRGARRKLVKVDVQGNHYFSTDIITERMLVQPAGLIALRHGRYSRAAASHDETSIQQLYQANGFHDVRVRIERGDGTKPSKAIAVVRIDEGPLYRVAGLTVNGVQKFDMKQIHPQLSTVEGQPFSEVNVGIDRGYITRLYNKEGFADMNFTYTTRPGPQPDTLYVTYNVTEGQQRFVRDVLISGNHVTSPRLYEPALHISKGDPLSLPAMSQTLENLAELGVFERVNMGVLNQAGDTRDKYVIYELLEGHRYRLAGGLGAEIARVGGSSTSYLSPSGSTGFVPRANIDLNRENMFGLGHTLNFKGRLSTLDQLASINYYVPRYHNVAGRNITFSTLWENSRNVNTFSFQRLQASTQVSQKLSRASTILGRISFHRSSIDQSTLKINPLLVPAYAQPDRVGQISGTYIFDRRDNPADARRGIYSTVDAGIAEKWFASTLNFARFVGTNSVYRPIGRDLTFAQRIQFGWIAPYSLPANTTSANAIPLPERLYGGGSASMRGFPDNQAGPRDPVTGFPLGGNALLFSNTELRFPLIGANIGGVLFWDAGNIYSTLGNISFRFHQRDMQDFNYMVHAAGFGIRYKTPLGPVRVDLAYSMNAPRFMGLKGTPEEVLLGTAPSVPQRVNRLQFFFSIGQAF